MDNEPKLPECVISPFSHDVTIKHFNLILRVIYEIVPSNVEIQIKHIFLISMF